MSGETVQRSIRIPKSLYQWIDELPEEEGKDFANKVIRLLYIGKRRLEYEKGIINQIENKESREKAE